MIAPDSALSSLPSPDNGNGEFIARLTKLVLAEANTARRQVQQLWDRPLAERVAAGRAIANVSLAQAGSPGLLTLRCPRNQSRFREGDMLILSRHGPFQEPKLLVTLEYDEDQELLVSIESGGQALADLLSQPENLLLDEGYLDLSDLAVEALNQAADTAAGRERLLPLLNGQSRPHSDYERYEQAHARAIAWGLNDQQAEALAAAYASDLCYLIQGPPGTGKTQVLARLAQLLAEDGERVLITAFTHRAINHALNTLAELELRQDATPLTAVKIGRPVRADDLRVPNYETFIESPLTDLNGAYVVGATPFATRSRRLGGVEFDTVIFDEASQVTLPLAIMAMLSARRFVFIGDHRQLPPVLTTRYGDQLLRDSVFAALVERGFDTMLEQSYRLNRDLAEWPSRQFYADRLRPVAAIAERRISYPQPPARLQSILDPAEPKVFVDLGHRNATTRCEVEASLAVDLITTLLECGMAPEAIGVVAPYRAQGRAIRGLLRRAMPDAIDLRRALVIDTVERMQGQERDLVIVSLTTSQARFAGELADFIFQPERLNVAITRPRSKLIILGSRHLLTAAPAELEQQEWLLLLEDLLNNCTRRFLRPTGSPPIVP